MVLLDVVRRLSGVRLIVAHVNHGIRQDAAEDAKLVRRVTMSHNIEYVENVLHLGERASEEAARKARYNFLRHTCKKYNALAILTAHHKDDVIETAIMNIQRGTGWRGLSSLRSTHEINRPFLTATKSELQDYAMAHSLQWRHDSTNDNMRYARNRVRQQLMPQLRHKQRQELYEYIVRQNELTDAIDHEVAAWTQRYCRLTALGVFLPRYQLLMLPQHVAHETLQNILRHESGKSMTRPLANRALLFAKVAKSHKTFPINASWRLRSLPHEIIVERTPLVVS